MNNGQMIRAVQFIDNYFPVIDGVTETVHEYAKHMNAMVVCPAMESHYHEKNDFPFHRRAVADHVDRRSGFLCRGGGIFG